MDKHKLILPISILLGCLILGGFFYAIQLNKQQSIEKQQRIELEAKKEADQAKAEQDKKEYVAKRKNDCLNIYKTEGAKWNNITGWRYSEQYDECLIKAKDPNPKSKAECDERYPVGGDSGVAFFVENMLCKEGSFENSF